MYACTIFFLGALERTRGGTLNILKEVLEPYIT
jgi:hypothetical protein